MYNLCNMKNIIQQQFKKISQKYTNDESKIDDCWSEIVRAYDGRAYHNLNHISTLYTHLSNIKELIDDFDMIFYAICYHDIVYDISSSENELQSALLARDRLYSLGVNSSMIDRVYSHIMATKSHQKSLDEDTNLFIDADLAILGSDNYDEYINAIREEYRVFGEGRERIVKYFLSQPQIYHTKHFYNLYEEKAIINLSRECRFWLAK